MIKEAKEKTVGAGFHACPQKITLQEIHCKHRKGGPCVRPKEQGITLIALVVTIIVLLILAGVTIAMVVGDNGILTRAKEAKTATEEAGMKEEIQIAHAGSFDVDTGGYSVGKFQTEMKNKGYTVSENDSWPVTVEINGKTYEVTEQGNITIAEITENIIYISKSTEKEDSYVGYYADINNDGTVDGIIYADLAVGNTGSSPWGGDWGPYNIPKEEDVSSLKDYFISTKTYEGQTTSGKYKANDGFGEKEVLVPVNNSSEKKDRFYIMSLKDYTTSDNTTFSWYTSAYGKLNEGISSSTDDFGAGKTKTKKEIDRWNSSGYGAQDNRDLWGVIQAEYEKGWFVPSKGEWSAFGGELEITKSNYSSKGLSIYYWSSSQSSDSSYPYSVYFPDPYGMALVGSVGYPCPARLGSTF